MLQSLSEILTIRPEVLSDEGIVDMVDLATVSDEPGKVGKRGRKRLADEGSSLESLRDPEAVFAMTYPTEDVRQTLNCLVARFEQPEGSSGTIVLTGRYGLGKSHVLLTAHHALRAPEVVLRWSEAWHIDPVRLPPNARVVTRSFIHRSAENLWDAFFEAFGRGDLSTTVKDFPDGKTIESLLDDRPTVLIFDELERWYDALGRSAQSKNRNFIQALTEVARRDARLTLVTSVLGERPEPAETLRRVRPTELAFRSAGDRQRVLLFRLFANHGTHDLGAMDGVVDAYVEAYRRAGLHEMDAYRERMRETYPFTPELLDILTKKVPNLGGFQNTRGSLRFLARVLRRARGRTLLSSQNLPFTEREVRNDLGNLDSSGGEVVRRALGDNYEAVPSSLTHKDELFSAITFYSIADPTHPGITEDELLLALLDPGENPNEIKDSLRQLRRFAWNLHLADDRYVFRSQENPQARIHAVAQSQQVTREAAFAVIEEMLKAAWGDAKATVLYGLAHDDLEQVRRSLKEASGRPLYLVSTSTLSPFERLRLQNLHPSRNLVLLVEPSHKPERESGQSYELLTDPELTERARIIEASRLLLEGKPDPAAAQVYRTVRGDEEQRLKKDVAARYGFYVSWHRAGSDEAPVDASWFELGRVDEFSAARFLLHFEREFGGDPAVQQGVKRLLADYLRRPVRDLVLHFEETPGTAVPHRRGMVEDAVAKLARQGQLGLQTPDGKTWCRETVDRLPADALAHAVLVDPPPPTETPDPPELLPTHRYVMAHYQPDTKSVLIAWELPEDADGFETLVQRYQSVRGYDVGRAYKMDLDETHESNLYHGLERQYVDAKLTPGLVYHYYVFLVDRAATGEPRAVLSQRCDVRVPVAEESLLPDTLVIPPQPDHGRLLSEVEKRVMSSKHVPKGKYVDRVEISIRGAQDLAPLAPMLHALPLGTNGSARLVADLRFVVRDRFKKDGVLDLIRKLPKLSDVIYEAVLHLADVES